MRKQRLNDFPSKVILFLLMLSIFLISCGYSNQNTNKHLKSNKDSLMRQNMIDSLNKTIKVKSDKYFTLEKVTIILASELDMKSININVQDYIENGKTFIPVFTTLDKFKESTKGSVVGNKIIEINPFLFLSILNGKETLRINPTLLDESYFNASDLKQIYKFEIDSLLAKMPK